VRIEAETLQEAFEIAAHRLNRSVTDLPKIRVIQKPSKGVLGFFKKPAIIEVEGIDKKVVNATQKEINEKEIVSDDIKEKKNLFSSLFSKVNSKVKKRKKLKKEVKPQINNEEKNEVIVEDMDKAIEDIKKKIKHLFSVSCFDMDEFEVYKYDDETIGIKIDGPDAALLIGKEGYRYNSLNFMLYHWINSKYGFKVRLEIAEFLEVQEEMLRTFLKPFIDKVKEKGYGKTKPFNGILVYLALEILREAFPDKYVAVKDKNGEKFIVIGDKNEYDSSDFDS
jgi:spoIIIJ-associated protein